jgi:hypothetical protein
MNRHGLQPRRVNRPAVPGHAEPPIAGRTAASAGMPQAAGERRIAYVTNQRGLAGQSAGGSVSLARLGSGGSVPFAGLGSVGSSRSPGWAAGVPLAGLGSGGSVPLAGLGDCAAGKNRTYAPQLPADRRPPHCEALPARRAPQAEQQLPPDRTPSGRRRSGAFQLFLSFAAATIP